MKDPADVVSLINDDELDDIELWTGSPCNEEDLMYLDEVLRDLTKCTQDSAPKHPLPDSAGKVAESLDPDYISDDLVKQTNEDLGWGKTNSAYEGSQKAPEEKLSLAGYDQDRVKNKSGIEQSVPKIPEPQVTNNNEHNNAIITNPFASLATLEMGKFSSIPPAQSVSVSKNTHSLREGDSRASLPSHELGVELNPTEEILSGSESQAKENPDNSGSSSDNQVSSDHNNDRNIIQVNPVLIAGNLSMYIDPLANPNIIVKVVGSKALVTIVPSKEPVTLEVSLANLPHLPQPQPQKRSSSSDSDCLTEAGPSPPVKRQRTVQFPDDFKQMETVDLVKECDQFLKDEDNFTSCVGFLGGVLSQIGGLESMTKTKATYEVMSELLTTSCATKFSWAGQNKKSEKIGIKNYLFFCKAIFELVDPGGIVPGSPRWNKRCNKEVMDAIKNWLKSAPNRK